MELLNTVFFLFVLQFSPCTSYSPTPKRYRPDYSYNRETKAFYKLHIESRRGWQLEDVCGAEGASLMVPTVPADLAQVHGMFKQYPDLGELVYVGNDGKEHESAEEVPIINMYSEDPEPRPSGPRQCYVVTRYGDIASAPCFRALPFVCKVAAGDAFYDARCGVYGRNYEYHASLRSCYMIPSVAYPWNVAYTECRNEGAHLAIINSAAERDELQRMAEAANVKLARTSWFFYVGVRAEEPVGNARVVFKTINNETLEQAGFSEWSPNEPNNARGREYCGTLFKNDGRLNDVDCDHEYGFICEKEVP